MINSCKLVLKKSLSFNIKKNFSNKINQLRSSSFTSITDLKISDQTYKIQGWVNSTLKSQKNMCFFHLTDGTSNESIQIVMNKKIESSLKKSISYGTSIICTGRVVKSKGKQQNHEFVCDELNFIGELVDFPFHNKEKSDDWDNIRQHLHLRFKSLHFFYLQKIRSKLFAYVHQSLQNKKYYNISTPIITKNDCEGGGEAFIVLADKKEDFFGDKTNLTVSGQLHLEAIVLGLNKVYNLSPCFRSEPSVSRKHLSEFTMLEVEETYLDSLDLLMDRVEMLCKDLIRYIADECKVELEYLLNKNQKENINNFFNQYIRITYEDALNLINQNGQLPKLNYGSNLNSTYEKFLVEHFNNTPIFITHFPSYVKPFYMKTKGDKSLSFDLIYPVSGEVCGGSIREENYEKINKIFEINSLKDLDWYKDLRKEGSLPHAGFGLGVDRFVQSIVNLSNIREVVPFPRWIHHCKV